MSVVDPAFSNVRERAFSSLLKPVTTKGIFQQLFLRFQYSPFIKVTKISQPEQNLDQNVLSTTRSAILRFSAREKSTETGNGPN